MTVSTMPAPLAFGAAVTVRDSDAWKTGSCRRALPMSASGVAVVKRADNKKTWIKYLFLALKYYTNDHVSSIDYIKIQMFGYMFYSLIINNVPV